MASVFEVRDEVWQVVERLLPEVPEQVGPVAGGCPTARRSTRSCSCW